MKKLLSILLYLISSTAGCFAAPDLEYYFEPIFTPISEEEKTYEFSGIYITAIPGDGIGWCNDHGQILPDYKLTIPAHMGEDRVIRMAPDALKKQSKMKYFGCQTLMQIPEGAFADCSSLERMVVTYFEEYVMQILDGKLYYHSPDGDVLIWAGCNTTHLTAGDNMTRIGKSALATCTQLQSAIIPSSVTSIGENAFSSNELTEVVCLALTPPAADVSSFATYDATLYVPDGSLELYRTTEPWSRFASFGSSAGIHNPTYSSDFEITSTEGTITISAPDGTPVSIFGIDGRCRYSGTPGEISLEKGVYLIRVGTVCKKIIHS